MELDDIDKVIIENLQVDGRMPFSQLSPVVGLSEPATRQRVNKLIDRGVMQVVAVTDPAAVGLDFQAMIGICTDGDMNEVADALAAIDAVEYLVIVTGRYDLLAEIVCRDSEHLLRIVNEDIRRVDGVKTTEVFSYLRLVKQSYSWGTA